MSDGGDPLKAIAIGGAGTASQNDPTIPASSGQLKMVTVVNASAKDLESSQVTKLPSGKKDPYLGATVDGRYKLEKVLGEGGMGVVYRCSHTIIGKKVAMKVLRADLARDKEVTERFLNEAKSASAIGNPHIIDISDFGLLPDGSAYFVMEYLEGHPLTKIVEPGKSVPTQRIIDVAKQLAEGLAAAHRAGIVHRDLKPDNIYLVERGLNKDFVKILDFGIAKVSTHAEGRLTRAGAVFGTPHYMSPEQAAGAPVDHRGDIYSFGVILYELASGKVPFDADNFMGILTQHMYKAPVPIRALVPQPQDVPPGLEAIVLKCLSKRPEQRYASMEELLADLDKLVAGMIPDAVPEMMNRSGGFNVPADYFKKGGLGMPRPVPATPLEVGFTRTRWPLIAGIAGVLTAVLVVVVVMALGKRSDASPPPVTPTPAETASAPIDMTPQPGTLTMQVVLAVEPLDARVFAGDQDLGTSPVVLEIPDNGEKNVEIRREGYKTTTLIIDSTQAKRTVKLEKLPSAAPVRGGRPAAKKEPEKPPATTKPPPKPPSGADPSIVDPWANKK